MKKDYSIIIVGAGPAGIGIGIALEKAGIREYLILDKYSIGASFKKWPKETRFISPSFTGNFFGMPDLNAISPDTSPAFTLQTEHPTGLEYASYLEKLVDYFDLPIKLGVEVTSLSKVKDTWQVHTKNDNTFTSNYVIWAAGEFQYPNANPFDGADYCEHIGTINKYSDLKGDHFHIIGGYESGFDIATYLLDHGKRVTIIDKNSPWNNNLSDSSVSLSPYTRDRMRKHIKSKNVTFLDNHVDFVEKSNGEYIIHLNNRKTLSTIAKPILATGFSGSTMALVKDHFKWVSNRPLLTKKDESTLAEGLFLVGSHVQHGKAIFCFIYKFRQRFPVVAEELSVRLGTKNYKEGLDEYRELNMWMDDLSCCERECSC